MTNDLEQRFKRLEALDETQIIESVAKAICSVQLNGGDPNQPAIRWNGTVMEPQDFPAWRDYLDEARVAFAVMPDMMQLLLDYRTECRRLREATRPLHCANCSGTGQERTSGFDNWRTCDSCNGRGY